MTSFLERIKMQAEEKAKIEIERIKKEAKENEEKIIKEAEKARKAEEKARKEAEKQAIKAKKAEEKARKEAEKQAKQAENKGKLEGMLETAKNLLKEGFSIDNVAKFTNLTLADVKALTL